MRIMFKVINEIFTFKRVIQYFIQKTLIVDYAQCFKKHLNKIN